MKKFLCVLGILILLALMVIGVGLILYSRTNDITQTKVIDKAIYGITSIFE